MEEQIRQTLSRSICGGWDRGFLESILEQLAKGRKLSGKQLGTVNKVLTRNDAVNQAHHDQWQYVYHEKHEVEARRLADYYMGTGYFVDLSKHILAGAVPNHRAYLKMSGNKYAQKVLETHRQEPKYAVGTLVSSRAAFRFSNAYFGRKDSTMLPWPASNDVIDKFKTRGGFILETTGVVRSAAKGAKTYKILPIGATNPIFVEERFIKIKKR